jgi:RNA polymerase sigma-70 factor, ECF subfamily
VPSTDEEIPDWNRIVDSHARRVVQIGFKILGSEHDAEEVAQDVFKEAFLLHRRKFIRDWTGLLVRLATLRSLDRRRARKELVSLERMHEVLCNPSNSIDEDEMKEWLRAQVAQLPERQGAVVTLICFQQMSRDEVAKALEMSVENVSATLYQARCRLKESISSFVRGS